MKTKKRLTLENSFYNTPGHVYWKDTDGVYLGCNYNNAVTLGLKSPKEIIGKTDFDLVWGKQAKTFRRNDLYVVDSRNSDTIEEIASIQGRKFVYLSQKVPLIDKKGKVIGVMGISVDITGKANIGDSVAENINAINIMLEPLSERELEIMGLIVSGKKISEIATRLNLDSKTVHAYHYRIFSKLKISSDVELVRIAMKYGF